MGHARVPQVTMHWLLHLAAILAAALVRSEGRLPGWLYPVDYRLEIVTQIDQPYQPFSGTVTIELRSERPTQRLVLNAHQLDVHPQKAVTLRAKDGPFLEIQQVKIDVKLDRLAIQLERPLRVNATYVLKIHFNSVLRRDNHGFYSSTYADHNTTLTDWLAVTQFEPNHARKAFPCFDDPRFKAPFRISLAHSRYYRALSNMPVNRRIVHKTLPKFLWTQFLESQPMQTYMVAWSISKFDRPGFVSQTRPGCPITTWARPDAVNQTQYASEVAPRLLTFYENLFDLPYRHPKLDQLALPDFTFGSEENWGLTTFAEDMILYDSQRSSLDDQQGAARAVAMSVVHQWFGNLVTITWWHELWLKNAFALYLSRFGVDALNPQWEYKERHALQLYFEVLADDAHQHAPLVRTEVPDESHMWAAYDEAKDRKAAVLLAMLHRIVGEQAWLKAMRRFLATHANGSATVDDFWGELQRQVRYDRLLAKGLNVSQVIGSWLQQPGYPLLTVTRDYGRRSALVEQRRFYLSPDSEVEAKPHCWWLPLSYSCASAQCEGCNNYSTPLRWLSCQDRDRAKGVRLTNLMAGSQDWLLLNARESSPIRVNYDPANWELLNRTLSQPDTFRRIDRINRAQLVDDIFNLAWIGAMDYPRALSMLAYLQHEDEYVVWAATVANFERINRVVQRSRSYRVYKTYMRMLLERQFEQVLSSNDSTSTGHRPVILQLACQYELPACLNLAGREMSQLHDSSRNSTWLTILERETLFCTSARFGTQEDWDQLEALHRNSNSAVEQELLVRAMACSRKVPALERVLTWLFDGVGNRRHNVQRAFTAVTSNPVGYQLALSYVSQNIKLIRNFCSNSTGKVVDLMRPLLLNMSTKADLNFISQFLAKHLSDLPGIGRLLKLLIELGQDNIRWRETKLQLLLNALKNIIVWRSQGDLEGG